jgi:adenosylhomocysteinase
MKMHSSSSTVRGAALSARLEGGRNIGHVAIDPAGSLKVLRQLRSETENPDGTHAIILQHILPTTVEYIDQINAIYPVDLVIAIVYSVDAATVDILKQKGYRVLVPPSLEYMKQELWRDVLSVVKDAPHPIVYQEVGGYLARWTHEFSSCSNFKGCVEDTKNGLWAYQAAQQAGAWVCQLFQWQTRP